MKTYTYRVVLVAPDDMPLVDDHVIVHKHRDRVQVLEELMTYLYNPIQKDIDEGMHVLSYGPLEYTEE